MPGPEDLLWRAAAAVARRRGFVTDARVDIEEPMYTMDYYGNAPASMTRRSYRVTVTMQVEDLDYTTASAIQLSEIVQRHIPPERDETLEAIRSAATGTLTNPNALPTYVHDIRCNASRTSPRTPGRSGCSCSPIPTDPAPAPEPTPSPKKEPDPPDGQSIRFSLLELDL